MMKKNNNRPRIAVIGLKGLPAFGGAATVGENLLYQLHEDFKFTVLSVDSHASEDFKLGDVEQKIFRKFPIEKLNVFFYYLRSCLYVLFRSNFDVIHLHHTDGAFILPLLRLKYKVVLTSHAQPQFLDKWPLVVKWFFSINEFVAIKMASVFTCVSRPLRSSYNEKYTRELLYIPNGVDATLESKVKTIVTDEPYLMFAAGRIIPSKGLHFLLSALTNIRYKGKLKVAGNLDHLPSYKKKVLEQAKGLDVEFCGLIKKREELLSMVRSSELFVFPSVTEAMSIMLMEAALVKKSILCSDIPANKAVFTDEEVEYFESANVSDLENKLQEYFKNPDPVQCKAVKAYERLKRNYAWNSIAKEYKVVYNQIVSEECMNDDVVSEKLSKRPAFEYVYKAKK